MKEILIVPDVHGRRFWEPALQFPGQVVFLGDYVDPYPEDGIGDDETYENLLNIIDFKEANAERVTLLIGNHELGYFDTIFKNSRSNHTYYSIFNEIFAGKNTRDLFHVCKQVDKYLFSHAGVSCGWYKRHFRELMRCGVSIEEQLNNYFLDSKMAFDELGPSRGGSYPFGSPLWADLSEIWYETKPFDPNIFQIAGHTRCEDAQINIHIAGLDTKQLYLLKNDELESFRTLT